MALKPSFLTQCCLLAMAAGSVPALANVQIGGVVIGNQDQTLSGVDVVTHGSERAIEVYNPDRSGHGSITLSSGNVSSENGDAIYLLSGTANLTDVNIDTGGKGININNYSNADLLNTHVTTNGQYADGLWLAMDQSNAAVNNSSFATTGDTAHAFNAQYGKATLNNSKLSTSGQGSYGLYTENEVSGSGNTIVTKGDSGFGVFAARGGKINLSDTSVTTEGKGTAALLSYVDSVISGDNLNVSASGDSSPAAWVSEGRLDLKNSHLSASGESGAGLLISDSSASGKPSVITLDNTLVNATNGPVVQINSNVLAGIDVSNNSHLSGDVRSDTSSRAILALSSNSSLAGAVNGLNQLSLDNSSRWLVTGNSQFNALHSDGDVVFQPAGNNFKTLTLKAFDGDGSVSMQGDIAALRADHITITDQDSGNHLLSYGNHGKDPTNPDNVLPLVTTSKNSSSQFQLAGGAVDAGAFTYHLEQRGDEWVLAAKRVGDGGDNSGGDNSGGDAGGNGSDNGAGGKGPYLPSPTAATALGIVNALPTAWYSELSTLRSRMGELRKGNRDGGVWAQTIGGATQVDNHAGVAYRQQHEGVNVGVDSSHEVENGRVIAGLFSGIGNSDLHFASGSSGRVNSFFIGSYASWLSDEGWFSDAVLKLNNFNSTADARMSDGSRSRGGYSVPSLGVSLEGGRHIEFANDWFIEPSVQLAAMWSKNDRFSFDNGLQAESGSARSKQAAIHGVIGKNVTLANGMLLQPWLRVSAIEEMEKNNQMKINGYAFNNDLAGTRGEATLGLAAQVNADTQLYAEAGSGAGRHIEMPWHAAAGVRWSW
ncbi:autotransporter outer membrane beta-barrel domain-containing protein [Enterobacteriaceae bacterium 89]|nr:autotransporter outer membrane beta-barrel domain-containing protein [Enterobacteriaceae bacterium 89]